MQDFLHILGICADHHQHLNILDISKLPHNELINLYRYIPKINIRSKEVTFCQKNYRYSKK